MDEKDIPIYFHGEFEPKSLLIRIGVGAALGAIGGALLYFNDRQIASNVMNHANRSIVETYHSHLVK